MTCNALISVDQLAAIHGSPECVIVDCRFDLADPEAGRQAYALSHLPGARYAHLNEHLSGPITPESGRHPLPDPKKLCEQLGAWGICPDSQVVAYDDSGGPFAARLWWLLRWLGHRAVAVLDGGFSSWQAAARELTPDPPEFRPTEYQSSGDNASWISSTDLSGALAEQSLVLVDARAPERYRGEAEPIDPVAGHVPGAINAPWKANLDPQSRFLPPGVLAERYQALLGANPAGEVVHMCGSGVTACHNMLAMHAAGLPAGRLYAGSWSEWIRDPQRPVEAG